MSFEYVVQKVITAKLKASTELMNRVTGVFDNVPQDQAYPYVTIGEDVHAEFDTNTTSGSEVSITIHTWSQVDGRHETKLIQGDIYNALHKSELTEAGYKFLNCFWAGSQSFIDSDGETRHGVSTFNILMQRV